MVQLAPCNADGRVIRNTLTPNAEFADKRILFPAVPEEGPFQCIYRSALVFKRARS